MRTALLLLVAVAACTEQSNAQCPANTGIIGQYALAFSGVHDAGNECIANPPDAGPIKLTLDDAGVKGATLCLGSLADGGPQLQLLIPGKGPRTSDLSPDGGFHFASDTVVAPGTACFCDIAISDTFDGYLLSGSSFQLRPDGGLPVVTGVSGTVIDRIYDAGTASRCDCSFPCTVTYSISGAPF